MKKYLVLFILLITSIDVFASALTSTATGGLFSAGTSWVGGIAPVNGDTLTIVSGSTITFDGGTYYLGTNTAGNDALTIAGTFDIPYNCPSSTLIFTGDIEIIDGAHGTWTIGSILTPYQSTSTLTFLLTAAGTSPRATLHQGTLPASIKWYGSIYNNEFSTTTTLSLTSNFVNPASNSVILANDVDAKPGQKYMIAATHLPAQTELLTCLNYDRATNSITFTSNFLYAHSTGAPIGLVSRNIICKSTNATAAMYWRKEANTSILNSGYWIWDNVEYTGMGSTGTGIELLGNYVTCSNLGYYSNGPFYHYACSGGRFINCVIGMQNPGSTPMFSLDAGSADTTIDGCYFLGSNVGTRICYDGGANNSWNNSWFVGGARAFSLVSVNNCTIVNSSMTCLTDAPYICTAYSDYKATNFRYVQLSSSTVSNTPTIVHQTNANYKSLVATDIDCIYYSGSVSTPTVSSGYLFRTYSSPASLIVKVSGFNGISGSDRFYTGSGMVLRDLETVRTLGSPSIKMAVGAYSSHSWATNPMYVTYMLSCNTNDTVLLRGYIRKNSDYGSNNLPSIQGIFSYANTTVIASTMTNVTDTWNLVSFSATATSSGTLTIRYYAYNEDRSAGDCVWFDDVRAYIGNNVYSLGEIWLEGYPVTSPIASTIDASNVWNASTNTFISAGSFGQVIGTNVDYKSSIISNEISQSSDTIITALSSINVDLSPVLVAISTSTENILANIDISSNTLDTSISAISLDLSPVLTAIDTASNTIVSELGSIAIDLTPVLVAIDISSNTLYTQTDTNFNNTIVSINTSSNTLALQISTSTLAILDFLNGISSTTIDLQTYDSSMSYVYDTSTIEVDSGIAKLTAGIESEKYIGAWHFNETEGTTVSDVSGNGHDGTLTAPEPYSLQIFDVGLLNNAVSSPGESEAMAYVNYGNIANFTSTDTFSIEGWIYQAAGYEIMSIAGQYDSATQKGWFLYVQSGYLCLQIVGDYGTEQWLQTYGITGIPALEWHHIAVTYDGTGYASGVNMYLDGVLMEQSVYMNNLGTYDTSNSNNFCMGGLVEAGMGWIGKFDEFSLYNVVLSSTNVEFKYNAGVGTESTIFGGSYSSAKPSIQPLTMSLSNGYLHIAGFDETLGAGNQGQVKYILSSDSTTWYYFAGSSWTTGGNELNNNTQSEINSHIELFPLTGAITYRAYLISDGSQAVELDENKITYVYGYSVVPDQTIINAINISSNTLNSQINISSSTLSAQISGISCDLTPVLNAIDTSSNTLYTQADTNVNILVSSIDTSSSSLSVLISTSTASIVVDNTDVLTAINTSSQTLAYMINVSSNTLDSSIAGISVDLTPILTAIDTSSNTVVNAIYASSGTALSSTTIANSVWSSLVEDHSVTGSFGELINKIWKKTKSIFITQ